ncbi:hypothetical protein FNV43_RR00026 [Rhamnella rubrinervis]|uniref:DRBM domain-containing protein n=1 Tax=Rhamnella rubrinervis TaxID=2594499 RepID=A0A8K0HM48_9ROSA|nr:hypothetical protein FNV43_RR00026 [Rhamnella rubrinervis]
MDMADLCPTEDAIHALFEYLVDPLLPVKSSLRNTPSQSQQQAVAEQVHAVVLLYNYYHRKQHPELEFLGFDSFCKLAVVLRPALLAYLTFMQGINGMESEKLDKKFSILEKTIMEACDISKILDASREVPNIEGWPISEVSVLLVDSKEENCYLLFSSITRGVWSVIQKDVEVSKQSFQGTMEEKYDKKGRFIGKPLEVESKIDEAGFQKLAFLAVKEATGISQIDLKVLENHVVYSLSKDKTATSFYIMKCTKSVNEDVVKVPIKDAIDSLQGALVRKSSGRWAVTPVVEYFHVLPYVGIFSEWISREERSKCCQDLRLGKNLEWPEDPCKTEVHKIQNNINDVCVESESSNLKENGGICKIDVVHAFNEPQISQNGEKSNLISDVAQVDDHPNMLTPFFAGSDLNGSASGIDVKQFEMVNSTRSSNTMCRAEKVAHGKNISGYSLPDQDGIGAQSMSKDLEKLQATLTSRENILSCTALKVIMTRRDKLSLQLRHIEDEIAQCDSKIQSILNDNGEDNLALKIDSVIEGCNDVWLSSAQERTYQLEDQCNPQCIKRKRLSEAIPNIQNACQELDGVCYENNWVIPSYRAFPAEGGFRASVTVKGADFKLSTKGNLHSSPHEARESAAAQVLVKLRRMVGQPQ